jgi:hypothetical protein
MFVDAAHDVIRHADIKRAVFLAGEEVDVIGHEQVVKWIPGSTLRAAPE